MDKQEAIEATKELGYSYFYDEIGESTNEEIVDWMQSHIAETRHVAGLPPWESRRDGLQVVLAECSDAELDNILLRYYGQLPERVGGSRPFFSWLHDIMDGTIEKRLRELS